MYRLHERLVNLRSEYNLRMKSGVTASQIPLMQAASMSPSLQQSPHRTRPELDEVTLRYIQDLLAWVEENQRRMDSSEWGADLPTVESHLGSHRGLHQSIEDFKSKIDRARADEVSLLIAAVCGGIKQFGCTVAQRKINLVFVTVTRHVTLCRA